MGGNRTAWGDSFHGSSWASPESISEDQRRLAVQSLAFKEWRRDGKTWRVRRGEPTDIRNNAIGPEWGRTGIGVISHDHRDGFTQEGAALQGPAPLTLNPRFAYAH